MEFFSGKLVSTILYCRNCKGPNLGLGHLVGYSEYNRTIVLRVVRQSYDLYEESYAI